MQWVMGRCWVTGLSDSQAGEAQTALASIPVVTIAEAGCGVDGEEPGTDILEQDIVTCSVRLILSRPAHRTAGGFLTWRCSACQDVKISHLINTAIAYASRFPILLSHPSSSQRHWFLISCHDSLEVFPSHDSCLF